MHHILLLVLLLVVMSVLLYRERTQVSQVSQGFVDVLQGRYIRIEMGQVTSLNLAEIEVTSEKGGANIIRPSTRVTISSSHGSNSYPGSNFVDQNPDTMVHTSGNDKGSIEVDLGATVPIYHIIVTNRADCCRQRANGAVLTILNSDKQVLFTADPIRNKMGSTISDEADSTANDRSFYKFTYFPSTTAVVGSDTVPAVY